MPLYVAIHVPREPPPDEPGPPADLPGLARLTGPTRWLRTLTPDLHDDRHVSLWEAESADAIREAMRMFHFFDQTETAVFRAREWGPEDVLAAQTEDDPGR